MKAYRGDDGKIRLFRPNHNMSRMVVTANRACLPTFDEQELLQLICKLVQVDQEWVPHSASSSLYIRPTLIGMKHALTWCAYNRHQKSPSPFWEFLLCQVAEQQNLYYFIKAKL